MPPDTTEYLLGEMNAKLDTLIARSAEDRITIEKLTTRVAKLEAWRWLIVGGASAAGGFVSLLVRAIS
jgi:hypothetical protein